MKDEKKTSFFKKIFGHKSSCCSFELEEFDSNEGKKPSTKDNATNCCCCSPTHTEENKDNYSKK